MGHQKISLFLVIILIGILLLANCEGPDLVIELFRHGARGPLNDTFDPNPSYWGENIGQLTPVGMRMHYLLGSAVKSHYAGLLTSYDPDTIYIRSTDFNRTIMSGFSHMYGVFEATGPNLSNISCSRAFPPYSSSFIEQLSANLTDEYTLPNNLQIVPIHTVQTSEDYALAGFIACPMARNWSDENQENSETLDVFESEMSSVTSYLQEKGLQIETFKDLSFAGDNAVVNMIQQISLPGDVDPNTQYYKDLKFASEWFTTKSVYGTQTQISLYSLNLLNTILDYMNMVQNGTSALNFVFLSAHDTTLMALLSAFNVTTKDCLLANYRSEKLTGQTLYPFCTYPQFASNLIFEFYNTNEPYIIFYYDGISLPLCGSSSTCTLSQFQSYVSQITGGYTKKDYLSICQFPDAVLSDEIRRYRIVVIVLSTVAFTVVAALLSLAYILIKKNRKMKDKQLLLINQAPQQGNVNLELFRIKKDDTKLETKNI